MTQDELRIWNRAIRAAMKACREIDMAAAGQGHSLFRRRAVSAAGGNPYGNRSGEIHLGAMRCHTEIRKLLR